MPTAVADVIDPLVDDLHPERGPGWLRRGLLVTIAAVALLALAGLAGFSYDRANADRFLPGTRVAGVDVGGMEPAAVSRRFDDRLSEVRTKTVYLTAGSEQASPTLGELGVHSDAAAAVRRAEADAREMGLARRLWHRLSGNRTASDYPVRYRLDRAKVDAVLSGLAKKVDKAPKDAAIDTSSGFVSIRPALDGQVVDREAAMANILGAGERVANEEPVTNADVELPVVTRKPKVTGYADVILVRTGENRLYHYENGALVRSYVVATGVPQYPTPKGQFKITLMRRNPTWVNPDPGGWGASLPPSIPPGPGNPLGTRAMNLSAPGIRIHGTSALGSLGRAASHGCIRMSIPDAEALFEKVGVNTPVVIIQGPAAPKAAAGPVNTVGNANAPIDLEGGG